MHDGHRTMLKFKAPERRRDVPPPTDGDKAAERRANELIDFAQKLRARQARDNNWNSVDFNRRVYLGGRCFLASDFGALMAAYAAALAVSSAYNAHFHHTTAPGGLAGISLSQFIVSLGLGLMAMLWLYGKGHYRQRLPLWETLGHFAKVSLFGFMAGGFIQYSMKDSYSRLQLGLFWIFFGLFMLVGRSLTRHALTRLKMWRVNTLVIGNKKTAAAIVAALKNDSGMGFYVTEQLAPETLHSLNSDAAWKQLLTLHGASHAFIALEGGEMDKHNAALRAMARSRIPHSIVPPWLGLPASNLSPHHFMMRDVFFLQDTNSLRIPVLRICKRGIDILASATALVALMPLMITVALLVRRDGGSAFFWQPRVGRNGKLFSCYKFRSMRVDAEDFLLQHLAASPEAAAEWAKFQKLKNDVRITPIGHFIRRTSIDELPQLINVLKGDMSLVGPRPMMPEQAGLYGDDLSLYESVRPGITGPWQVCGRSQLTFNERVALESWYARNWNMWTDVTIVLKTFPVLFKRGHAI